jgi:putative addiction module component (TIGR02574 family)
MVAELDPKLKALSTSEKLILIDLLWGSIPEDDVPVPQFHRELIEQRLAAHRANPDDVHLWEDVRRELENEE